MKRAAPNLWTPSPVYITGIWCISLQCHPVGCHIHLQYPDCKLQLQAFLLMLPGSDGCCLQKICLGNESSGQWVRAPCGHISQLCWTQFLKTICCARIHLFWMLMEMNWKMLMDMNWLMLRVKGFFFFFKGGVKRTSSMIKDDVQEENHHLWLCFR